MYFKSEEALRDFLVSYMREQGISCQVDFQLENGWRVDILAPNVLIECKFKLTLSNLDRAWSQVKRYKYYLQDRIPVIAGLSDESGRSAINIIQQDDVDVWALDEISLLQDYYKVFRFKSLGSLAPSKD